MKRLVSLMLLFCMLACVPTPDVDAVKQKDTNVLIETVRREQDETPAPHDLPERFVCDFTTDTRNVHVTADVPIEVLSETGTFPMLRVERRAIGDADRLTIAGRVLHSDTLYIYTYRVTREMLAEQIRALMQEPTPEEKAQWMADLDATEEAYQEMLENRKQMLAELQKQYNELPEDDAPQPFDVWDGSAPAYSDDFEHHSNYIRIVGVPFANADGTSLDSMEIYVDEQTVRQIEYEIGNRDSEDVTSAWFFNDAHKFGSSRISPSDYDRPHDGATVAPIDAIQLVKSYFAGICDYSVADVYWANNAATDGETEDSIGIRSNTRWGYLIHLTQNFSGANAVYCSSSAMDPPDPSVQMMRTWPYESVTAVVDGDGTLISFVWLMPLTVTDVISESVKLLPFEDVEAIFRQQTGRMLSDADCRDASLDVEAVQLGLFRIREKNNMNAGLMVPVWYFTGKLTYTDAMKNARLADGFSEAQAEGNWYDMLNPLLIVNAVDGTVIDPWKGY